ncbi:MAG: PqqD family protein [Kiritimatiellia bacterium]
MKDTKVFRVNSPAVVAEAIDGEVVVIHMEQGVYYSLEQSAGWIWEMLEQGFSEAQVVAGIRQAFTDPPPELEEDVNTFLLELMQKELILPAEAVQTQAALPTREEKSSYQKPRLQVFDDMQDLLLADPIHDFDGQPWPGPLQG